MSKSTKQRITDTLEKNYMPYAMSVIVSRAIPEIDGFKPSHRKLLYTMYKMKLLSGPKMKSANVVGQTMKLNPHGDQAIYATLVRLTRGYDALLCPYIDSKGNFGKATSRDMKFAAARYTEVKLDQICEEIFKDMDKDVVDFVDSYDGQMKEPVLLPTTFPNILVNANKGIAVGMASSISSFNLSEVVEATRRYIDDPSFDVHEIIKGPDFSTGGYLVYKEKEIRDILENGLGSFKLRGKYRFDKENSLVEVFEIPYTTTVEAIIEKIVELIKSARIKDITDVRDETDLSGMKIAIDIKKGTDPHILMSKLFKYTTLEDSFSCNFNILINGRPKVLGVKEIIDEWIKFRIGCIRRKTRYEIDSLSKKLHLLRGLKIVLLDIDKAIRIVKDTDRDEDVVPNLMSAFSIDDVQGEFIADIKLRNLNKDYIIKRIDEISSMEDKLQDLSDVEKSDDKIKKIIKKELAEVLKKYKAPRKTEIMYHEEIVKHDEEHEVEDFNARFFLTSSGYIKKVSLTSLRAANVHKLKEDDYIVQEADGANRGDLLIFTDKCNLYKTKAYEIDDHKASSLGVYCPNLVELEGDERPVYIVPTSDYKGDMVFGFESGKASRVPLASYETKTNRKKLIKAYSDQSKLISAVFIEKDEDIMFVRYGGANDYTVCVVNTSLIPVKVTRNSAGIQIMRMKKGSFLYRMRKVEKAETPEEAESSGDVQKAESHPQPDTYDKYKSDRIPVSGVRLDPVDILEKKHDDIIL